MPRHAFLQTLQKELDRVDALHVSKRRERVISGFTKEASPKAIVDGKQYRVFNSNDYLGLRHEPQLLAAEHEAGKRFGTGPGAVRFISGTMSIHRELELATAVFHGRKDAMVFSSAFATNLAVLHALIKGQSADSLVSAKTLVLSDALNHRSIIDGIRVANLEKEARPVFEHLNPKDAARILKENVGKYDRALVITDGVFSMLGEYQNLKTLRDAIDPFDKQYPEGVWLVVDDAHGVGAFGATGRGTEEMSGAQADVLIGTYGKAFGADGGYVTADETVIAYLREAAATYIYSNSVSPGTAGAAKKALEIMSGPAGKKRLRNLEKNVAAMKTGLKKMGLSLAADSKHPIQPLLIGDPGKTKELVEKLFSRGIIATAISYPVVAKGKDEIRIQLSAVHTDDDVQAFLDALT